MRVACLGGGPGGLFLAILLKLADPSHRVTVFERNAPGDTFGFGVVFSEETLANLAAADPVSLGQIAASFRQWSAIELRWRGRTMRSDGHAFAALARTRLLGILTDRARGLGVDVAEGTEVTDHAALRRSHDLVVACDGVNSGLRGALAGQFGPSLQRRRSKYAWFGTTRRFDQFTFIFTETEHGPFQAHVYPYDCGHVTFIVETDPDTWRRAGLDAHAAVPLAPGRTDAASLRFCQDLFAEHLDGHPLLGNNSRWLEFGTVRNESWQAGNVALLGDAAHTVHFTVGSGTKLAMEDAIALAGALGRHDDLSAALKDYEAERRPLVASMQRAAQTSLEWFEGVRRYLHLPAEQFFVQLLTRSQRVTYDNLKLRDPDFVAGIDRWFAGQARDRGIDVADGTPPMFFPYRLRGLRLANRIVVSPMAQYSCAGDGVPTEWHLVHLGSRAVGGAGLVFTEMTCVSPEGRITPGCPGLWNDQQATAWRRVVDFVHQQSDARIGLQLGHAGRKGSTRVMWEGEDVPLEEGNWPLLAPSPVRYRPANQVPRQMDRADMDAVREQFARAARYGVDCGFDLLELHMAHGYLLSTFLSPVTNRRTDGYGGGLAERARYPLEVFDAVRAVWPEDRPMSVRISATDWVPGGFDGDDAVAFARMLAEHGCDIVDVSTGQVTPDQRPAYGRLYQTPFADRIRHEVGLPTMTVGAVSSVDDANTIIVTGRADLCLLARPHLVDPYWTLNAAVDLGYTGHRWPRQYLSGQTARRREQQP
ncbi:MAG TPA: bifunctional salicylyl-CoA 5-hydroxylase/oxidoreductase [Mycobacteriales bacterium]|nr:bifunctional salicylyl-CoA 5-hydroxylase/oxidoreductase [Mycobacteriales bacterium]